MKKDTFRMIVWLNDEMGTAVDITKWQYEDAVKELQDDYRYSSCEVDRTKSEERGDGWITHRHKYASGTATIELIWFEHTEGR